MTGISGLYHGTYGSPEGQIERLREENEKLRNEIACMREEFAKVQEETRCAVRQNEMHNDHLLGIIEGLKYAIRCNGISGAEVKS